MIVLFDSVETTFESNGIGVLSDTISCTVTEERNGIFEAEIEYPITGIHYESLKNRNIIYTKPDPYRSPQPFRIYRITRPMSGRVKAYAQHISYDLIGIPVSPFSASTAQAALQGIKTHSAIVNPFAFWTDKSTQGEFNVEVPTGIRSLLGGSSGSVLDIYNGEYEFDKWDVRLWSARGQNSGVTIRYGKNLTDLTQDENISNIATGIYPYYVGSDETVVELPEKIVHATGTYNFDRITPIDFSGEFDDVPTIDQLRSAAQKYVKSNDIGVPKVSITVSFQPLDQTEEYAELALLERVNLCDTVTVEYSNLGVSATAKCVKTVYDVLKNKYTSIVLGDAKTTLADTIAVQQKEIETLPQSSILKDAINSATKLITGNRGGYVVLHDATGDGQPDEILIMDTPNITTSQKVWRWNNSGLGFSSTGYNGPYATAITQDGAIVANFITVGLLNASLIKTGMIQSQDGRTYFDLDASQLIATQLIAESASTGQFSAHLGMKYINGIPCNGMILKKDDKEFMVFAGGENNADIAFLGTESHVLMLRYIDNTLHVYSDGGGILKLSPEDITMNANVIFGSGNIDLGWTSIKVGNTTVVPATCYTGTLKDANGYTIHVSKGLITEIT